MQWYRVLRVWCLLPFFYLSLCVGAKTRLTYDLGIDGGWVPYQSSGVVNEVGIFERITQLLAHHTDIEFKAVNFPPKRSEHSMATGLIDVEFICLEWFPNQDHQPDKYVISDPIFIISEFFISRNHFYQQPPNLNDLYQHPIGTIAGYHYFDDDAFQRIDFLNEGQLIQGLKLQRFDTIILEQETAKYWARKKQTNIEFVRLHSRGELRLRLQKRYAHLVPQINRAIARFKANQSLKEHFDRLGIEAIILP